MSWQRVASGDQDRLPDLTVAPGQYLLELRFPVDVPRFLEEPIRLALLPFLRNVHVRILSGGIIQVQFEVN